MAEKEIYERLGALEAKVDLIIQLQTEHRSSHFQYALMLIGSVVASIGALCVSILTDILK